jgi:hypothetical protein
MVRNSSVSHRARSNILAKLSVEQWRDDGHGSSNSTRSMPTSLFSVGSNRPGKSPRSKPRGKASAKWFPGKGQRHSDSQPVAAGRSRRHSWRHASPPVCKHNAGPVFGSASRGGGRFAGCSSGRGRGGAASITVAILIAKGSGGGALLSAVATEAERRGRVPASAAKRNPAAHAKPKAERTPVEEFTGRLTKGKLNAVRAAFKAGVKPSVIARQFGISQSDVRKALAAE